jgi:CSLREA domain-containing protein
MLNHHRLSRTFALVHCTLAILLALAAGAGGSSTAHALGFAIEVNSTADNLAWDGWCTLREAINNANADAASPDCTQGGGEDGIFFSDTLGTATITLNSVLPAISDADGLLIDGGGDITISGNNAVQILTVTNTGRLTLKGLVLQSGNSAMTLIGGAIWNRGLLSIEDSTFIGNNAALGGGAIFNTLSGSLAISGSSFVNNSTGGSGGAISNETGEVTIHNSSFSGNSSAAHGGAVYNIANSGDVMSVTETSMSDNVSADGAGIYHKDGALRIISSDFASNSGGALFNERGQLEIAESSFIGNDGDGMYSRRGNVLISHSSFSGNTGNGIYNEHGYVEVAQGAFEGNGGHGIYNWSDPSLIGYAELRAAGSGFVKNAGSGVYNDSAKNNIQTTTFYGNRNSGIYSANDSLVTVWMSTFLSNTARYGGGIHNEDSILHAHNITFSGNVAGIKGGGVANLNDGTTYLLSDTFSDNLGKLFDGLYNDSSSTAVLHNTILANGANSLDDCRNDPGGSVTGSHNLIEALAGNACGLLNGVDGNIIGLDPKLGALVGSPAYYPFVSVSPALDAGNDVQCAAVSYDSQNGVTRPQGAHCDIGSYEEPFAGKATSPREAIAGLSGRVGALVDTGTLSPEDGKALIAVLDDSSQALEQGDVASGIESLAGFIDQVNGLTRSGELEPTQGQALVDQARSILDELEGSVKD